jgi:transcription elongation factor S-II
LGFKTLASSCALSRKSFVKHATDASVISIHNAAKRAGRAAGGIEDGDNRETAVFKCDHNLKEVAGGGGANGGTPTGMFFVRSVRIPCRAWCRSFHNDSLYPKNGCICHINIVQTTKAGIIIAKQRTNPDKQVARLASEIVAKWKNIVEAEKKKKGAKMQVASPAKNGSGSSPVPSSEAKGFSGDTSKRKWVTDGVDIKRTGVPTRDNCVGLLYDGLAFMSEESTTHVIIKAMEVERAAFVAYKGETPEYRAKLRSLFQNLKNKSNRELGPRVMLGEITAERFVTMTHDELKSAERRKEDDELERENMKKAQVPMAEKSISDALKCGRCGQKKVSYSQAQTRSADEPMTTFCECTVCGNRWKVRTCSTHVTDFMLRTTHYSSLECASNPNDSSVLMHFVSFLMDCFMHSSRGEVWRWVKLGQVFRAILTTFRGH